MLNKITRAPIMIGRHTVVVMHVFTRMDHLEDVWMDEVEPYYKEQQNLYKSAAKQFIDQLEDNWCVAFLEALQKEIEQELKKAKK